MTARTDYVNQIDHRAMVVDIGGARIPIQGQTMSPKSAPKLGFLRALGAVTLEAHKGSPCDASKEAVSIGFVRGLEAKVDRQTDFGQYSTVFFIL